MLRKQVDVLTSLRIVFSAVSNIKLSHFVTSLVPFINGEDKQSSVVTVYFEHFSGAPFRNGTAFSSHIGVYSVDPLLLLSQLSILHLEKKHTIRN